MANFGRKSKKRRDEPGTYRKRRASEPNRPKTKTPRPESGRKFLRKKCTTTAANCQGKCADGKQNRRKPLNCWEIAQATRDFSFSNDKS